jgi:ADP-heptose:LPS heptosyltransferase
MNLKTKIKSYILKKIAQKRYKKDLDPLKIKKILIFREGGIGDAVCNYPLIREIKKVYPNSSIDIFASLSNNFMYKYNPHVSKVYTKYKKRQWIKTWLDLMKMRSNEYDLIIDNTVIQLQRTIYTIFINAKYVLSPSGNSKYYGFDRTALSLYYKTYKSHDLKDITHIVDTRLKVLKFLNISNPNNKMEFYLPNKPNEKLDQFINNLRPNTLIGLNTEGSTHLHTLSDEQIIEICKGLDKKNISIVMFSLPNNRQHFENLINKNKLTNTILSYKTNDIYDAAEIMNKLDVMISPDTSFVHIASGLNMPIVALFKNNITQSIIWGPKSSLNKIITPEDKTQNTVKAINPKIVIMETFNLLEEVVKS